MFLDNPDKLTIRKIIIDQNDHNSITVLACIDPAYGKPVPKTDYAVRAEVIVTARNIWNDKRRLFAVLHPHPSITVSSNLYNYLKDELVSMSDAILDIFVAEKNV